ncbi:hypothetical protein V8C42DRAFT_15442 [Trichoderma barbatum]
MRCNKHADGFSANRPILPSSPGDSGRASFHCAVSSSRPWSLLDGCLRHAYIGARLCKQIIAQNEMSSSGLVLIPDPHCSWRNERRVRCQLKPAILRLLRRDAWPYGVYASPTFSLHPCDCC